MILPLYFHAFVAAGLRYRSSENKAAIVKEVEQNVWPAVAEGKVKPVVFKRFSLSEAVEAHRLIESSKHIGKILLLPWSRGTCASDLKTASGYEPLKELSVYHRLQWTWQIRVEVVTWVGYLWWNYKHKNELTCLLQLLLPCLEQQIISSHWSHGRRNRTSDMWNCSFSKS